MHGQVFLKGRGLALFLFNIFLYKRVGEDCVKYLKIGWNRKEGRGNKNFKKGRQSGSRGGCLNLDKKCIQYSDAAPSVIFFLFKKEQTILTKISHYWTLSQYCRLSPAVYTIFSIVGSHLRRWSHDGNFLLFYLLIFFILQCSYFALSLLVLVLFWITNMP